MIARTRTYRIDRAERTLRQGYAHHNEEQRQSPPGHAERLAAHEERVAREEAEITRERERVRRLARSVPIERRPPPPRPPPAPKPARVPFLSPLARLRRRVVLFLAGASGEVSTGDVRRVFSIPTRRRVHNLLSHAWFTLAGRNGRPGGGSLPSLVTLTPAGWREAERLADPTPKGG